MKRNILYILSLLAAAFLMNSCQKDMPECIPEHKGDCQLTLSLDLTGTETKAIANDTAIRLYESSVNKISYLVFASNGALEAMKHVTGNQSSGPLEVSFGQKTVYAFVNVDPNRFSYVTHSSELYYTTVDLKSNSLSNGKGLTMYGSTTVTVTQNTSTYLLPITVSRHVARIVLGRVTNALSGVLAGKDISVDCVFLTNLPAYSSITGQPYTTSTWYARCGRAQGYGDKNCMIWDSVDTEAGYLTYQDIWEYIGEGESTEPGCALYFFPNNVTTDRCGWAVPFTSRYTRIVVAADIDDETYYYPVSITGAQANRAYTLDLTITRLGSKDPDTFEFCEVQDVVINIGGFDEWDDDFEITF